MKQLLNATAAIGLALAFMAPAAIAQTAPNPHPHAADKTKADDTASHVKTVNHADKITSHATTAPHQTIATQHQAAQASPWAPNGALNRPAPNGALNKPAPNGALNKPAPNGALNRPAPNGAYVQGHTPGDNRLPIYTQQGLQHDPDPAGGTHDWHRGDRYDGPRNVVSNWNQYHLDRPPAGYEYIRNGNQFVLIAVTSGIIADVLANALSQ